MHITTFEIEHVLPVKRSNLQQWIEKGYIVPSIERAVGVGTRSLFSEEDILKILFMMALVEAGYSFRNAAIFLEASKGDYSQLFFREKCEPYDNVYYVFIKDVLSGTINATLIKIYHGQKFGEVVSDLQLKFREVDGVIHEPTNFNFIDLFAIGDKYKETIEKITKLKMRK